MSHTLNNYSSEIPADPGAQAASWGTEGLYQFSDPSPHHDWGRGGSAEREGKKSTKLNLKTGFPGESQCQVWEGRLSPPRANYMLGENDLTLSKHRPVKFSASWDVSLTHGSIHDTD